MQRDELMGKDPETQNPVTNMNLMNKPEPDLVQTSNVFLQVFMENVVFVVGCEAEQQSVFSWGGRPGAAQ